MESVRENVVAMGLLEETLFRNAWREEVMARRCDDGWENADEVRDGTANIDRDNAVRQRRVAIIV